MSQSKAPTALVANWGRPADRRVLPLVIASILGPLACLTSARQGIAEVDTRRLPALPFQADVDSVRLTAEAGSQRRSQGNSTEPLSGRTGSSAQWNSGWIDLTQIRDFSRGQKLKLRVGGTARKVVIKLLSRDDSPDDAVGIDGGVRDVPKSRVLEVTLEQDHHQVRQISIHGGPNPWNRYPMGGGNGPATLESVELVSP
jgi:hypothetical protein